MEYISAEEFLKQPKEIKKVFLEWWKPSTGDLISFKVCIDLDSDEDEEVIYALKDEGDKPNKFKDIPLFVEGQLRKFIENYFNTNSDCKIELEWCNDGYTINIVSKINDEKVFREFPTNETEVIKVYWKVALKIAEECIKKCSKCTNCETQGIYAGGEKILFCHQANSRVSEDNAKECKCYEEYEE